MLSKLALRNLLQHRSKSLIVGALMAFGVMLLVVGNSVMDTLAYKMRTSFTNQYSGDLFIYTDPVAKANLEFQQRLANMPARAQQRMANAPPTKEDNTSIFSAFGSSAAAALPAMDEHWQALTEIDMIEAVSPQTIGIANVQNGEGAETRTMFWGLDAQAWQSMGFAQHLQWQAGSFWQPGDKAIALSKDVADSYAHSLGRKVEIGEEILMTVNSEVGIVIRPVKVSGIFSFKTTAAPQLGFMSLVDLNTSQSLLGLHIDTSAAGQLNAAEQALIANSTEDSLFGGDDLFASSAEASIDSASLEAELIASLASSKQQQPRSTRQYNFVIVKLKAGISTAQARQQLQHWFQERNLIWTTGDWQQAAGMIATMADNISWVLNGFMVLIAVVSIIIIMNTLVISVTERMVEIGTMRALGGQRGFIRRLILLETLVLALAAGIAGVIAASIVIAILASIGIEPSNSLFYLVFGGEPLYPELSIQAIINAFIMMIVAALLASLYPLGIALKISPVKAMQG
ncbi:MAG: ABC transporter permease [Gammaproteobacteria bacterium]|nr:ABC transporter permease [Gammaproteobacteria bacterium]